MSEWEKFEGYDENLPVTHRNEYVHPSPNSAVHSHEESPISAFTPLSIRNNYMPLKRTRAK